jgi:hypothetical protein
MLTYAGEIWERYPNGASVRDRNGRYVPGVIACNPETGEVIQYDRTAITRAWARLQMHLPLRQWWGEVGFLRRHGFWPAPLTIEPRQWLHIGLDDA